MSNGRRWWLKKADRRCKCKASVHSCILPRALDKCTGRFSVTTTIDVTTIQCFRKSPRYIGNIILDISEVNAAVSTVCSIWLHDALS